MRTRWVAGVLGGLLVATGAFGLGRATAAPPDRGYADGVRAGRAEQATLHLPATGKQVFDAGYVAGAADAFGGFDGGWDTGVPYVVVIRAGGAGVTYRIASRIRLEPGADYYVCAGGAPVCRRAH